MEISKLKKKYKKNDIVYLLGTSNSLPNTPWDKKDADYWGCFSVMTQQCVIGHRMDALFELHPYETWGYFKNNILKAQELYPDIPIFMQRVEREIKNSVEYPLQEIQESVNNVYLRKYFTSSIAFMIVLAILFGYKKMILHGISLSVEEEEFSKQRSCAEAWLNYGLAKGVDYEIAQPSALMNSNYIYGYEPHKDVLIKAIQLKEAVNAALRELEKKEREIHDEVKIQEGGLRMAEHFIEAFRI